MKKKNSLDNIIIVVHVLFISLCILCQTIYVTGLPYDKLQTEEIFVKTAPTGSTAILKCESNGPQHNFQFWYFVNKGVVIGPTNAYDNRKYKYEILSGNLTIRGISKFEEGLYECVSRAVNGEDMNIRIVKMIVTDDVNPWNENAAYDEYHINLIKILIVLITLVLVAAGAYFGYRVWADRYRYPRYLESNDDDEDSTEELFSAEPSTSKSTTNFVRNNKHKEQDIIEKEMPFSNVDISTDFQSILDTTNDK